MGVQVGFIPSPERFVFDSSKALSDDSILWGRNALSWHQQASLVREKASLLSLCII